MNELSPEATVSAASTSSDLMDAEVDSGLPPNKGIRGRSLLDFVTKSDASVRLMNALTFAGDAAKQILSTIGDYLDAPQSATAELEKQLGRKAANELEALVRAEYVADQTVDPSLIASEECPGTTRGDRAALLALFKDETIGDVVQCQRLSTRLANVLRQAEYRDRPFVSVLDAFYSSTGSLLGARNLGRKSVHEFRQACFQHVMRRLTETGLQGADRETAAALILREGGFAAPVVPMTSSDIAGLTVPVHADLAERLEWLLEEFDSRAADVVRRRYGIRFSPAATLEEIGVLYGITRERIRQIEAKALKSLRARTHAAPIDHLLSAAADRQWKALSQGGDYLLLSDLHERRSLVDPYANLALDILELELPEWLDSIALRFPMGWHAAEADREEVEAIGASLRDLISALPLPRSLNALETGWPGPLAASACELIVGNPIRRGYIMPARVGARLARAIGLHATLALHSAPLTIESLLDDYHVRHPNDPCSDRDAEIVMAAARHLFLEIEEGKWLALGQAGPAPPRQPNGSHAPRNYQEEPGTIAWALQTRLRDRGPTRLGDLLDNAASILPVGRSVNSIGPVLLTRHELFLRVLPGVYALPEHVPPRGARLPDELSVLLNDTQARLFALARYAGETLYTFPWWSPEAEYRLCSWARHSGGPGVLSSLLAVANVDEWPIIEAEKDQWRFLKTQKGRFELGSTLRREVAYDRPDLERVLAACVVAAESSTLNWMTANRLIGRRIDSHVGAGMLALLIQLGVIREPDVVGYRWQLQHHATTAVHELRSNLTEALCRTGELGWDSPLGREIAARVSASVELPGSWVDVPSVKEMVAAPHQVTTWSDNDEDDVERLMRENRFSRDAERREATLRWLLEE